MARKNRRNPKTSPRGRRQDFRRGKVKPCAICPEQKVDWKGRAQFLAIAARAMRQILVEHARRRGAAKRGGDRARVTLSDATSGFGRSEVDVLDVDDALRSLAEVDARKAHIVELRFFAGLTTKEVAEVLDLSTTTVEDDWYFARAWLRRKLAE